MDESTAKLQIEEYWNQRAESFDEAHENEDKRKWFEYFRNLMGASAGQSVLDIGTGTGFLAIMAAELGFSVTGIDFAEKMLDIARKKTAEKNLDIQYLIADLNSLPFEDESFDYIVNSRVLWTLTDPDKALNEWKRVLKKGGEILSFIRLTDEMCIYTSEDTYGSEVYEKLVFKLSSGTELIERCHSCGFSKVDLVKLPDIALDTEVYGEWYVLRAIKEQYNQDLAVDAVQAFWNRRSSTYEEEHEITSLDHWKVYLGQLVGENRSAKIIDLATGTGMIANLLGEIGYTDTKGLLASMPSNGMHVMKGYMPSFSENLPPCRFMPRCPEAFEKCGRQAPHLGLEGHVARCHHCKRKEVRGDASGNQESQ